jgi:hypothetical protein
MVLVNTHPEAVPERNQAHDEQEQSRPAKQHSHPRNHTRVKEFLLAHAGNINSGGKHEIKIKKGERRNQKIFFILSILPKCIAFIPFLLIRQSRSHTNPGSSTMVRAPK